MMEFKDYYRIMEIMPYASQDDIKRAYRRLARKFHPDVSQEPEAELRFKEIYEAYETLKDPEKRTVYNQSQKILKPYTTNWFYAKVGAWLRVYAQARAKKSASDRADQSHGNKQKSLFIISSIVIILLIMMTTAVILLKKNGIESTINHIPVEIKNPEIVSEWQALIMAILANDATGIEKLENLDSNTQHTILQNQEVKKAVVNFYISHTSREVVGKLEAFSEVIQHDFFQNQAIEAILLAHYQHVIDEEMNHDNPNGAIQLLKAIQAHYPQIEALANKYTEIEAVKTKRLTELAERYQDCLAQTPLIESTPYIKEVRQRIAYIDPAYPLLNDPKLPALFAKTIKRALKDKEYTQVEKLLADWQMLLPDSDSQRDALKLTLIHDRQVNDIVNNLMSGDKVKIAAMLSHLEVVDEAVRTDVLGKPKAKEILLNYHFNKIATLMHLPENKVPEWVENLRKSSRLSQTGKEVRPSLKTAQAQLAPQKPASVPTPTEIVALPDANAQRFLTAKLQECKRHLTKGQNTALNCYRTVLNQDPKNTEALAGLQELAQFLQVSAEKALRNGKLNDAKNYLANLEKVNANSVAFVQLTQTLKQKLAEPVKVQPVQPKVSKMIAVPEPKPVSNPPKEQKLEAVPMETSLPLPETTVPPTQPVTDQAKKSYVMPLPEQPTPLAEPLPVVTESPSLPAACDGCQCSDLLRQISMGVKPLTEAQQGFFQKECH